MPFRCRQPLPTRGDSGNLNKHRNDVMGGAAITAPPFFCLSEFFFPWITEKMTAGRGTGFDFNKYGGKSYDRA